MTFYILQTNCSLKNIVWKFTKWICIVWILKMNPSMLSGAGIPLNTLLHRCKFFTKYTESPKKTVIFSWFYLLHPTRKSRTKVIGIKSHNTNLNIFSKCVASKSLVLEQHGSHIKGKAIILKYVLFVRKMLM